VVLAGGPRFFTKLGIPFSLWNWIRTWYDNDIVVLWPCYKPFVTPIVSFDASRRWCHGILSMKRSTRIRGPRWIWSI
jgi:hypothetical protein